MKQKILSTVLFLTTVFWGCTAKTPPLTGRDIVYLDDAALDKFIKVLPDIIRFSQDYQLSLRPEQVDAPDYNEKYFQKLITDKAMQAVILSQGFDDMLSFLDIYVSITLGLDYLPRDPDDFQKKMDDFKKSLMRETEEVRELEKTEMQGIEKDLFKEKKASLENRKKLYNNVFFLQKNLEKIDKAMEGNDQ